MTRDLILKKLISKLFVLGIFLFGTSLLLPFNFRNIPLFIFTIIIVISLFTQPSIKTSYSRVLLANTLFFVFMLVSLIYSKNTNYALKRILILIPLVIIPLCFYLVSINKQIKYENFLKQFYICFYVSTVIFFVSILIHNYINNHINETIFLHYSERLNSKYGKYSMHPIYASTYISISLFFSIAIFKSIQRTFYKTLLFMTNLFLAIILVILARKGPILITSLIFVIYFFKGNTERKNLIYFMVVVVGLVLLASKIDEIRNRFVELLNVIINNDRNNFSSTSIRLIIYNCSIEAILNNPLFGYGVGDVKAILNQCYIDKSISYYNSHNQFLSAWLSAGLFGIGSLLYMFIYNANKALKSKEIVYISIMSLFFILAIFENILERQDGIILFSFFINFFAFKDIQAKQILNKETLSN